MDLQLSGTNGAIAQGGTLGLYTVLAGAVPDALAGSRSIDALPVGRAAVWKESQ